MPDEKFDEKEREKREEKSPDEKWRNDPLGTLIFACVLIWAGIVFLLENMGTLDYWVSQAVTRIDRMDHPARLTMTRGSIIALGAGLMVIVEIVIRLLVPAYRRSMIRQRHLGDRADRAGAGRLGQLECPLAADPIILLGLSIIFRGVFKK